LQLNAVPLPSWCPHDRDVSYDANQGILLIETRLPHFGAMPIIKSRVLKEGAEDVPANQKEAREFATKFTYLMVVRLLWESVQVDVGNQARLLCLNGAIAYDDPATGRRRVDTILSIAAQAQEVRELLLDRLDPEACFRKLRGVAAPRLTDLVPVAPVVRFDKADSRFIEGKEVLNGVAEMNLATMDWQDFEHLIRELFEKEFSSRGAEVRITQASRDRGVDAVVFDPDPLRGGKTIIQAKRYTNTVDLSAVRDLFGTVQAEGANKGILVTTSNFGPDAYAFVRGKPLTLVNGANLLHLLGKHGYHARIDLKQAKEFFGNLDIATKKPGKRP
jgi:restriction system protein